MLRVVTDSGAVLMRTDAAGIRSVGFQGYELPTDRNGQIWIYFSPHDQSRYVSATDVIEGRVPPERLAGKLVLIGTSAVGLLDIKTTPLDAAMPGVEVHAQVLETALTGATLSLSELRRPRRTRHGHRRGRRDRAALAGRWARSRCSRSPWRPSPCSRASPGICSPGKACCSM